MKTCDDCGRDCNPVDGLCDFLMCDGAKQDPGTGPEPIRKRRYKAPRVTSVQLNTAEPL